LKGFPEAIEAIFPPSAGDTDRFCVPARQPWSRRRPCLPGHLLRDPARSVWSLKGFCALLGLVRVCVFNARLVRRGRIAAAPLLAGTAIEQPLMNAAHLAGQQREVSLVGKQP